MLLALGAEGDVGAHEEVEGVVDGLEPGTHFFVEGAGEESELVAHGDDGAADGDAVVAAVEDFVEAGGDGDEGFAGAGVAVAGDERDLGVEEGVDEEALADALKDNRIGGAALDVFETEPLTAEAGKKFAGLANLLLTPHIAGVTEESNVRVSNLIADLVISHLEKST